MRILLWLAPSAVAAAVAMAWAGWRGRVLTRESSHATDATGAVWASEDADDDAVIIRPAQPASRRTA